MRSSLLLLPSTIALLFAGSGCAHPGLGRNLVANTALVAYGIATMDSGPRRGWVTEHDDLAPDEDDDVDRQEALAHVPLLVPPPPAPVVVPTRFDLGGAYGALAGVELDPCKAQGLAAGYGRVTVPFEPDGTPGRVAVEMPAGSAPAAHACIEEAFRAVRVAPFDGKPVNVRRAFFVK
jgi:hypothetical protein